MTNPVQTIHSLITRLNLIPHEDGETAFGAWGDTPITMTVLTVEPLGLLFAFNVNRDAGDLRILAGLSAEWTSEFCKASLENGRAWLPLHDLTGRSEDEIVALLEGFHQCLVDAQLTVGPGCVRCGCVNEANIVYAEGRTTRICPSCLERAIVDQQERESQLNDRSLTALLGLPVSMLILAGCWALLWFAVDMLLDWFRVQVIEINEFTSIMLLVLFVGTGAALGVPLGRMLRKSGAVRVAPILLSGIVVVCAVVTGEIAYVALLLFWNFGILNFAAAAQMLGPVFANYSGFWIANKVLCAGATAGFCITSASVRKTVSLRI